MSSQRRIKKRFPLLSRVLPFLFRWICRKLFWKISSRVAETTPISIEREINDGWKGWYVDTRVIEKVCKGLSWKIENGDAVWLLPIACWQDWIIWFKKIICSGCDVATVRTPTAIEKNFNDRNGVSSCHFPRLQNFLSSFTLQHSFCLNQNKQTQVNIIHHLDDASINRRSRISSEVRAKSELIPWFCNFHQPRQSKPFIENSICTVTQNFNFQCFGSMWSDRGQRAPGFVMKRGKRSFC